MTTHADRHRILLQPAHVSKAVQPYVEKLQKGAGEVKAEVSSISGISYGSLTFLTHQ
jgi:hypothetical protein